MSVDKEVDVLSYYFGRSSNGTRGFPKSIDLEGRRLDFIEGLRCLVEAGGKPIQVFNMTDGHHRYRLKFNPESRIWTLLSQKAL